MVPDLSLSERGRLESASVRVIGVTGTIGAGKSTVAGWLAEFGALVIDADALAHRLYDTDAALQARLRARFGPQVVVEGKVDRPSLARAVFGQSDSAAALEDLEAIVHPAVLALLDRELAGAVTAGRAACVVEAIKLVESGGSARCDELWVVVAAERVQSARLAARGVDEAEARRRLAAQGTPASWIAAFLAESGRLGRPRPVLVFDNSGSREEGRAQAERLWGGLPRR